MTRTEEGPSAVADAGGSYTVDRATGEVRATHTDAEGVTTTLAAGERVDPGLPAPFALPRGATVIRATRVEQGEGRLVTVEFTSDMGVVELADFYRTLATSSGFDLTSDLPGKAGAILAGRKTAGAMTFTLQAKPQDYGTDAQITVGLGIG
ncbi:hypothetical protein [Qipengyuania gaetbuli]|uniref:hypothetical protein n=1 Tax=Qipengyuania gaetbuli TaxID=266952 RepID=UPI001CD7F558|nr:hypothetical protein [Qipengyuania gaetbuli]MCA0910897.1 hypothetical protein [Qipengyuania gaetbuli]